MTEETKKPMVTVRFRVDIIRPDKREFKQQSTELIPDKRTFVAVDIPCTSEYLYNSAEINAAALGTEKMPDNILTPAGLAFIHKSFEPFLSDPEPEDFEVSEDSDWDEKETTSESSDDGWDTESSGTDPAEDEKWDENEEEW